MTTGTNVLSGPPKHIAKTAPSRGLSPVRSPLSATPSAKMPSPRTSPALRPQSPLSPRYEAPSRFEPLRPPSPRRISMNSRGGNSQRRANTSALKLPSLPRFHPSNFPSAHSSAQTTPESGQGSPPPPTSPRTHQRIISDAQKHLLAYQRDMISAAARSSTPIQLEGPESPRLLPIGSPGPVTPLQLESEDGGYLTAGVRNAEYNGTTSDELVEKLMQEEAAREWRSSSRQANR